MFGFLNVYKPRGKTSHDVVSILRKITGIKQIGHTGTLDPFAEGVLPICIGKATRLIEYLKDDKAYIATIQFGTSTTTYDIEGVIVHASDKKISIDELKNQLKNFEGFIEQIPPVYSAIKMNGKKLYEYARDGKDIDIKPRQVSINEIRILNFDKTCQTAEIYIECSKGTYIRSIANDLGMQLGVYGHLSKLIRVKAGDFNIEKSNKLENLISADDVIDKLQNPLNYLHYPVLELNDSQLERIRHGNTVSVSNVSNGIIILTYNSGIAAAGECTDNRIKCLKVFV